MTKEVMQQALEAGLESDNPYIRKLAANAVRKARVQPVQEQQQAEPPPEWLLIKNILDEYGLQAIDFVADWKAAQPVQEPVGYVCLDDLVAEFESTPAGVESMQQGREWLKDLQAAQSRTRHQGEHMSIKEIIQQLRVTMDDAKGQDSHFDSWLTQNEGICKAIDALKIIDTQPQQQAEPCVGKDPRCPCQDGDACHYKDCGGTKAWPVQRPWVELTEEEIMVIGDKVANEDLVGLVSNFRGRLARAIEQTLKERNT